MINVASRASSDEVVNWGCDAKIVWGKQRWKHMVYTEGGLRSIEYSRRKVAKSSFFILVFLFGAILCLPMLMNVSSIINVLKLFQPLNYLNSDDFLYNPTCLFAITLSRLLFINRVSLVVYCRPFPGHLPFAANPH